MVDTNLSLRADLIVKIVLGAIDYFKFVCSTGQRCGIRKEYTISEVH